jgi:alkylation response protein AidB-like acyl-CoA dehydrogenase
MAHVDAVAAEARAWFEGNWDPDLSLGEWWRRFAASGWAFPTWPIDCFGRGMSAPEAAAVARERRGAGAFGPPTGVASMMAGPTILAYGSSDQQRRFLPGIATGDTWCQLFSEPGAGSDLASVQTRAVCDGDDWIVNGQKVWTSGAQSAPWGILIARTNLGVPKQAGITYFVIEMDQPGVEVRPLREMTGDAEFNEVFLTDARVPDANRLGDVDGGWPIALATLGFERASLASGAQGGPIFGGLDMNAPVREVMADTASEGLGILTQALSLSADGLLQLVVDRFGTQHDPIARQELARVWSLLRISRLTAARAAAGARRSAGRPGPEASTGKLMVSTMVRAMRDLLLRIEGAHGMLSGASAPLAGKVQHLALASPAFSIAGGSDEIQRNIIGERVLGLPAEPRSDKELAFRDLRVGTNTARVEGSE